jgi:hypothetical protein
MHEEESIPRSGWRAAVLDSPLRIVVAFVLTVAGMQASSVIAARNGFTGRAAYLVVLCICLMPVSLFYGFTFRQKPVWSATLLMWLGGGILVLECLAVEAVGIEKQWAWRIQGMVGVVSMMYLVPYWPRVERALQRRRSNHSA